MTVVRRCRPARRQHEGAFLLTTALALLFLLGFMGLAVDFGRLFVTKSELQTAMDSCALAAARELNGEPDAVNRARAAGLAAGNLNRVHFQNQSAGLVAADIQFSEQLTGTYSATPVGTVGYVRCQRSVTGLAPLLLQALGAFSGEAGYAQAQSVGALAVATLLPSQTNCILPVGLCQRPGGYTRGEWVQGVTNNNDDMEAAGQFRWLDLGGKGGGAAEIKDILLGQGQCAVPGLNTEVAKAGKTNGAVEAWNTRFGVYKGSYSAELFPPDTTGYAWYVDSSTAPTSVWGRYDASNGYAERQRLNSPYQGDRKADNPNLKVLTGSQPSSAAEHAAGVSGSRVVTVVDINCDGGTIRAQGFSCMFMLHPMAKAANGKTSKMWLEYISDATAATGNPCVNVGLSGTTDGLRVPSLVN